MVYGKKEPLRSLMNLPDGNANGIHCCDGMPCTKRGELIWLETFMAPIHPESRTFRLYRRCICTICRKEVKVLQSENIFEYSRQ